jgi:lycopene beta-cyclase
MLGAGCSGLSLCYLLLERGVDAPILILDRKRTFEDDRTWCFWDVKPTPFSEHALKEWRSWDFVSAGASATQTTSRYPCKCLTDRDFYQRTLIHFAESPNVTGNLRGEGSKRDTERSLRNLFLVALALLCVLLPVEPD